jgi:hypothetical protein
MRASASLRAVILRDRAGESRDPSGFVPDRLADIVAPDRASVPVVHAELDVVRLAPLEVVLHRILDALAIFGVKMSEKLRALVRQLVFTVAQDRLGARRKVVMVGCEVPVPEPRERAAHRVLEALLAFAQCLLGLLALADIADEGAEDVVISHLHRRDRQLHRKHMPVAMQGGNLNPLVQHRSLAGRQIVPEAAGVGGSILGWNDQVSEASSDRFGGCPAECRLGTRVPVGDEALGIDGHDCIERSGDDAAVTLLVFPERSLRALMRGDVLEHRDLVIRLGVGAVGERHGEPYPDLGAVLAQVALVERKGGDRAREQARARRVGEITVVGM